MQLVLVIFTPLPSLIPFPALMKPFFPTSFSPVFVCMRACVRVCERDTLNFIMVSCIGMDEAYLLEHEQLTTPSNDTPFPAIITCPFSFNEWWGPHEPLPMDCLEF